MSLRTNWPVRVAAEGPVAVGAVVWQVQGQTMVTAIVKMTCGIPANGTMSLVDPEPLRCADEHEAGCPTGDVVGANETAPLLRLVDVLLTGHAYAPQGATQSTVRLMIAGDGGTLLDKALTVTGDLDESGAPKPFGELKLGYERAYGGIGFADNPMGRGFGAGNSKPPNIAYPTDGEGRTAGFGAIPASFPMRKKLLGDTPRGALAEPVVTIPPGFDWSYFQAAPLDQRLEGLRGDEWLVLEGLHPSAARLSAQLPGVTAVAKIYGHEQAGAPDTVPLRIDMVHIDADGRRCSLVWRGSFPVASVAHLGELVIVGGLETPDEPMLWPATVADLEAVVEPTEPLVHDPSAEPANEATISIEERDDGPAADIPLGGTVALDHRATAIETLPFAGRGGSTAATQARRQPEDLTVLPFKSGDSAAASAGPPSPPLVVPQPTAAQPDSPFEGTVSIDAGQLPEPEASPFVIAPAGQPPAGGGAGQGIPATPWAGAAAAAVAEPASSPPGEAVMPPPPVPAMVAVEPPGALAADEGDPAAEQEAEREAMGEAERQAQVELAARAEQEAEQQARLAAEQRAAAEAEERRRAAAESFRKEQEQAQKERERRATEQAKAKRAAAKALRQDMYGSFKRKK